jgi:hypothetical protein
MHFATVLLNSATAPVEYCKQFIRDKLPVDRRSLEQMLQRRPDAKFIDRHVAKFRRGKEVRSFLIRN